MQRYDAGAPTIGMYPAIRFNALGTDSTYAHATVWLLSEFVGRTPFHAGRSRLVWLSNSLFERLFQIRISSDLKNVWNNSFWMYLYIGILLVYGETSVFGIWKYLDGVDCTFLCSFVSSYMRWKDTVLSLFKSLNLDALISNVLIATRVLDLRILIVYSIMMLSVTASCTYTFESY